MHTAFVLSGGGSLGAVQVGMLQALADHRLGPDLLVGASAGALNAAYVAGHGFTHETLARLADVWRGLRRHEVFPFAPRRQFLALLGARPSLCTADGLHRLVRDNVTYDRLEHATIPIQIVATDVISGTEVVLVHGDPVPAVLASAAIPAVFPTVTIDGRVLFDGGVADNTPSRCIAIPLRARRPRHRGSAERCSRSAGSTLHGIASWRSSDDLASLARATNESGPNRSSR